LSDSPETMATTIGKPLPGIDVHILDTDTHELLPAAIFLAWFIGLWHFAFGRSTIN